MSKAEVRMWNEKSHATQGHNILNPSQADSLNVTPAAPLCLFMGVSGWDRGCFTTWELYSLFSTLTFKKKTRILSPQQSISTADKNLAEFIAPPSESSYNPFPYFPHTLDLNLSFTYFFSPEIVWILPLKAPPWHTMVSVLRAGSNLSDGLNARKYHFVTTRTLPKSLSLSNANLYFTETAAFNNVKTSFWHLGNGTPLFKKKRKRVLHFTVFSWRFCKLTFCLEWKKKIHSYRIPWKRVILFQLYISPFLPSPPCRGCSWEDW